MNPSIQLKQTSAVFLATFGLACFGLSPVAHGVTPAQVVIRWHIEHEIVVIPKSTNADRIAENFDVWGFELSDDEVAELDAL